MHSYVDQEALYQILDFTTPGQGLDPGHFGHAVEMN